MMRIFESLLEESNKKKFIKNWLGDDIEKVEEYDKAYEEYRQVFDNEVKKRGLNWQTSMTLEIFEEILNNVNDKKNKSELKKHHKSSGKSDFLSYVLANPDCDLTYLGALNKWDYFKIETWPGAILADSPKASLKGDTGAKWCIGWRDPAKQKFDQYTRDGFDFILIVKSDGSNRYMEEKYCIQIKRKTGIVEGIWTPDDNYIDDKKVIYEVLYGQEANKTINKKISGILKGIDIGIEEYVQPENKIVDIGNNDGTEGDLFDDVFYYKLYKSGTDQLIDGNDITTLEFIELKPLPKFFFQLSRLENVEKIILPEGLKVIEKEYFFNYDSDFSCLNNIKHIDIPDSVEVIEESAFSECGNLESIKLPAGLRKIGEYCFYSCTSLKHIDIPESVEEIGKDCFAYCSNLEYIKIPELVTEIGQYTFYFCRNLKNIEIPDSVTRIGSNCFTYCTSLKNIEIPNSVTEIGDDAFEGSGIKDKSLVDKIKTFNKKAFNYFL